jgi:hypothetical protein
MNEEISSLPQLSNNKAEAIPSTFCKEFTLYLNNKSWSLEYSTECSWIHHTICPWQDMDSTHPSRNRKKIASFLWDLKVHHRTREQLLVKPGAFSVRESLTSIVKDTTGERMDWYDEFDLSELRRVALQQQHADRKAAQNSLLITQKESISTMMKAILGVPGIRDEAGLMDRAIWDAIVNLRQVYQILNHLDPVPHVICVTYRSWM